MILPCASSLAITGVNAAPPISDREIIEKLVRLETGQEALSQRMSDLRLEMKSGQEALSQRMSDFRSEMKSGQASLNKRLDDSNTTMLAFFGAIIILIVALFAYIAWDRRTMLRPVVNKLDQLERNVVNDLSVTFLSFFLSYHDS